MQTLEWQAYQSSVADHAKVLDKRILFNGLVDSKGFSKQSLAQVSADGIDFPHKYTETYSNKEMDSKVFHGNDSLLNTFHQRQIRSGFNFLNQKFDSLFNKVYFHVDVRHVLLVSRNYNWNLKSKVFTS